jgi:hypothetical protein
MLFWHMYGMRHAARCLTCRDNMDMGLTLFQPAKLQERREAGERAVKAAFKLDGVFLHSRGIVRSCCGVVVAVLRMLLMMYFQWL